ncbi:hypothetical protein [Phenylobacterium sp.]|uniref:hypothetical protein n=1 Tax=Phenylobacterium sp. TaxID=1871053 RepID=UPI002F91D431
MRNQFTSRGGFVLAKTPSTRQQQSRRKLAVISGILALALASGVIGSLTSPNAAVVGQVTTGPFSYFPSE